MALDVTVTLTDEREATLVRLTNESNVSQGRSDTPSQFLRDYVRRDWLDFQKQVYDDAQRLRLRNAFNKATVAEQATITAILDKYR